MVTYATSATWEVSKAPQANGKSKQSTAGSFVRPSRPTDQPRGFLEALHEKYALEFEQGDLAQQDLIEISGKVVEEVGFDKIRKKLAELHELKIVILDGFCIAGILAHEDEEQRDGACKEIGRTCPKITELDLSRNLLTRWVDVMDICGQLKQLKQLKLIGNRLGPVEEGLRFEGITDLHIDETLLSWDEISALTYQFPSLNSLSASANQISTISTPISETITKLVIGDNEISSLSSLKHLTALPKLERLSLRGSCISTVYEAGVAHGPIQFPQSLKFVDISCNLINSWSFINEIPAAFPGLKSLRISGNPLFDQPVGPSAITNLPEKPMTVDEAYMLTLARLSSLQVLNYGKISLQDRSNGELYYLSLIAKELSAHPEAAEREILAAHPRYKELCETYGEPIIKRASGPTKNGASVNPRSVAARLMKMEFHLPLASSSDGRPQEGETVKVKEIPQSFNTYQVKAIVSRLFGLIPFEFKLIWETDELDPVSKENKDDEEWDSDDDGNEVQSSTIASAEAGAQFVKREVELIDSTRDIGFWFQGDLLEAKIRIEVTPR
ncbi:hypothetical protein MW887_009208 [Aspergillus wentii]|nr:hypothetical protein MW887_009208 [Aspergillus wentii]